MSRTKQFQHLKIKLEDIHSATNNFSPESCIGRGGFGRVYKGKLLLSKGETMVALKRLDRAFGQGDSEFWKEIMMLSFYRHENIISLLGYCDDHDEKILVYEYASKKSLDSYLASDELTWLQRLTICVGAARGLAYLHTPAENKLRIVHRDIKSSNILLDNNWNAKISDFGLSKFTPANNQFTYLVSNPAGTPGYIDPLYHKTGLLTKESDVYSFGVVLFEVLCGRLCYCKNLKPLAPLAREYCEENKISELICSKIKDEINKSSLKLFADIAYQCLKAKREERPLMTQVVRVLEAALDVQTGVHRTGILNVKVLTTINPDHYLVFYIMGTHPLQHIKTSAKYNNLNAENNEELALYVENFPRGFLSVVINRVESEKKHCYVGSATLELTDLIPNIPKTRNLGVESKMFYRIADLIVEVLYKPTDTKDLISSIPKAPIGTPKDGGLLVILIKWANLFYTKWKHSSVSLRFHGELRETKSIMETGNPEWLEEFTFMLKRPPANEKLYLELINHYSWMGLIPRKESIKYFDINLEEVVRTRWMEKKCRIDPGYLYVELQWRTSD